MKEFKSEELLENINQAVVYYQKIIQQMIQSKASDMSGSIVDLDKNQEIANAIYQNLLTNPTKFADINIQYTLDLQNLLFQSLGKLAQDQNSDVKMKDEKSKDQRFSNPAWEENAYFNFIKEFYLLNSNYLDKYVDQLNLNEDNRSYVDFFAQQFIDALSPSNFAATNPEVVEETLNSGMKNIATGMKNFLRDIQNSDGMLNITTTNKSKFRVGKNIATTKGKVIFRNEIMELICYEPKEKTYSVPILVVPPWINRYYIMDLSEKNSLMKYLVDNNQMVFLISWVNPTKKHAHLNFEDYLKMGVLDAIEQIQKLGYKKINSCGYCIGGTLLTLALSYLKSTKRDVINSATFLTTLIDFSKPGDIGAFISDHTFKFIEKEVLETGYFDGRYISNSFGLIRANDLVWSFYINNYLLGKSPPAFDILYWNSDSTNLAAEMYLYYLKNMYIENNMIKPNKLKMLDVPIDVTNITVPSFSLAAKRDHIALWDGVYDGYRLLGGKKTFCLTEAGHVAGVVNPASNKKYSHRISSDIESTHKKWLKGSTVHEGSWWNSWNKWLKIHSGELEVQNKYSKLANLMDAPGSYVKK